MKIEDVTKTALEKATDNDLYMLRVRFVNFYKKHFAKGRRRKGAFGLRHSDVLKLYAQLIHELKSRDLKYVRGQDIDTAMLQKALVGMDVRELSDVVVATDFVSIFGAFALNPKTAQAVDVTVSKMQREELEARIAPLVKQKTEKDAVFDYDTEPLTGVIIPLFDLVLRPKAETVRKKLKVLAAVAMQSGAATKAAAVAQQAAAAGQAAGAKPQGLRARLEARKTQLREPIKKPEETATQIRIPVGPACTVTATIVIDGAKGIKALYCGKEKRIRTYLFDNKKWNMASAKAWVKEHKEKVNKAVHDVLETFEYLIHHIEVDGDKEIIHHCHMYDHIGNLFEQAHLWIDKGKVYLDGKEIKDGYYHVIKGLEPTQEVAWSEEEAIEAGIKPKRMITGMKLKDKSKEW